jgi:hypothetical protein
MATGWGDRPATGAAGSGTEWLPALDVPAPERQRRWTVLLRWLLLIPQYVVLFFLAVAAFFVVIVGWFAALFMGRLPDGIFSFLGSVLAYETRVNASATLLVDRYPPFAFSAPQYPVQIELRATPLNRLAVFFRLILIIPAAIVATLVRSGWVTLCWVFWLIALILGRLPAPLYAATAAVVRYSLRLNAYLLLLTPAYPKGLFGDEPVPAEQVHSGTRPLLLDTAAKVLVVLFLLLGLVAQIANSTVNYDSDDTYNITDHSAGAVAPERF